jgi:hypothetical protein
MDYRSTSASQAPAGTARNGFDWILTFSTNFPGLGVVSLTAMVFDFGLADGCPSPSTTVHIVAVHKV